MVKRQKEGGGIKGKRGGTRLMGGSSATKLRQVTCQQVLMGPLLCAIEGMVIISAECICKWPFISYNLDFMIEPLLGIHCRHSIMNMSLVFQALENTVCLFKCNELLFATSQGVNGQIGLQSTC